MKIPLWVYPRGSQYSRPLPIWLDEGQVCLTGYRRLSDQWKPLSDFNIGQRGYLYVKGAPSVPVERANPISFPTPYQDKSQLSFVGLP